jgi:hypothetical protein
VRPTPWPDLAGRPHDEDYAEAIEAATAGDVALLVTLLPPK